MEKEEYISLVDTDIEKAQQSLLEMQPDEFSKLINDFNKAPFSERNDKFLLANDLINESRINKIRELRTKIDTLSINELDFLESLIGEGVMASSDIEDVRGLRDAIEEKRTQLNTAEPLSSTTLNSNSEPENVSEPTSDESENVSEPTSDESEHEEDEQQKYNKILDKLYGTDESLLQHPVAVEENLEDLQKFPTDKELLETMSYWDIKEVFNHIEIIDNDGNPLSKEETNEHLALFMEQVRNQTEMYVALTTDRSYNLRPNFDEEYPARLRASFAELIQTNAIQNAAVSSEQMSQVFNNSLDCALSNQIIAFPKDAFAGWHAAKQAEIETQVEKLSKKFYLDPLERIEYQEGKIKAPKNQYKTVIKNLKERIGRTDQKLQEKYGKPYKLAKDMAKAGLWSLAYSAGAALGPVGIGAVAATKLTISSVQMIKDMKKQKAIALEKGEKFGLTQYFSNKNNRLKLYGIILTAAGGTIGATSSGAEQIIGNLSANTTRAAAGIGLAIVSTTESAKNAYKQTKGPWYKKAWASTKVVGAAVAAYAVGMLAGKINPADAQTNISDASDHTPDTPTATSPELPNTPAPDVSAQGQMDTPQDTTYQTPAQPAEQEVSNELPPAQPTEQNEQQTQPQQTESVFDNLSERQEHDLKMLFLRDPREANQILGQTSSEWMNSHQLQEAWENGTLTDEQKTALLDFAHERFDAQGHYQDVEGLPSAAQMEAEARGETQVEDPQAKAEAQAEVQESQAPAQEPQAAVQATQAPAQESQAEVQVEEPQTKAEAQAEVQKPQAPAQEPQSEVQVEEPQTKAEAQAEVQEPQAEVQTQEPQAKENVQQPQSEVQATQEQAAQETQQTDTRTSSQKAAAAIIDEPEAHADMSIDAYQINEDGSKTFTTTIEMNGHSLQFDITISDDKILALAHGDKQMPEDMLESINNTPEGKEIILQAKEFEKEHPSALSSIEIMRQRGGRS
ncbi:MAG: hypothetical protein IKS23_03045 [Alphaproteobacteria bacterium]|nr:hypothetical protein [Alphaproteobacteria bacterium]